MKTFLLFGCFLAIVARADDAPIPNAILTENLEHPRKLEQCMKKIFPFPVKRFVGPMLADDKLRTDYAAIAEDGGRYIWRFRPALNALWKAFLYEGPNGSAVGVSTTAMVPMGEIIPPEKWNIPIAIDLRPCAQHFRK